MGQPSVPLASVSGTGRTPLNARLYTAALRAARFLRLTPRASGRSIRTRGSLSSKAPFIWRSGEQIIFEYILRDEPPQWINRAGSLIVMMAVSHSGLHSLA